MAVREVYHRGVGKAKYEGWGDLALDR